MLCSRFSFRLSVRQVVSRVILRGSALHYFAQRPIWAHGIYRLYLPNKQADVLYSSIPRNALRLRLEPPPSNVEAVWDNGDVLFFARYEELLNTSSGYVPETMGEDECIGMLELDEKLYSAQAHYINALTGDYREMPYGYVYLPMPRSKENIALNGEAWWLDV